MQIDPAARPVREIYRLLIGCVVPRPIAWVSSLSADGVANLAPFSFFTIAGDDPPLLLFCPLRRPDGAPKDTLRNVQATGEFVIHIVSEPLAAAMNQTAAEYPYGVDEFAQAGVTPVPSLRVRPPRVAEAPVAFECCAHRIVELERSAVVIGRVLLIHLRDEVYHEGYIQLAALQPIARLAGNSYARVTDTFELARPGGASAAPPTPAPPDA
ncbi:flavin reductase family protein [Kallotenue papyrolyticum]|uniref:flavin reductase family protein n=1 Tax=Kallotenue papyrolyticum TaxID=1325125 RepID=UPI0004785F51|nr:flavin reductase family protein [Kallotenue papyrolyticum]